MISATAAIKGFSRATTNEVNKTTLTPNDSVETPSIVSPSRNIIPTLATVKCVRIELPDSWRSAHHNLIIGFQTKTIPHKRKLLTITFIYSIIITLLLKAKRLVGGKNREQDNHDKNSKHLHYTQGRSKSRDNLQDLIQPQQEEYHKTPRPIHPGNKDDLEKVTNVPRHTPVRRTSPNKLLSVMTL